jgi:acetolactate synthase regulatory subunit
MRIFLEIEEQQTQEEIDLGIPQQIIRIEVTGKSDSEIKKLKLDLEKLVDNPKSFLHECHHDESLRSPCTKTEI